MPATVRPSYLPARGTRWLVVLALAMGLAGCARGEPRWPGWTGKVTGLVPDLVLAGAEIYKPVSVAFDDNDNLYVLDAGSIRLYRYSPEGALDAEFGRSGQGVGEFPYLDEFSDRVVAAGDAVAVVMHFAQQAIIWNMADGSIRSLRLGGFPGSVAFDGAALHATMSGAITTPTDEPLVRVHALDGRVIGGYGIRQRPEWDSQMRFAKLRGYNDVQIAMSATGRVYAAMRWWPSLQAYEGGEIVWDRWYDLAWLEGEAIADIFDRPRELLERMTLADFESEETLRALMTLSIAASDSSVVTLWGGSYAQVYSPRGDPGTTFKLFGPGADPNGSQQFGQRGWNIALTRDGRRLCVPEKQEARVLCYTLPLDAAVRPGASVSRLAQGRREAPPE